MAATAEKESGHHSAFSVDANLSVTGNLTVIGSLCPSSFQMIGFVVVAGRRIILDLNMELPVRVAGIKGRSEGVLR